MHAAFNQPTFSEKIKDFIHAVLKEIYLSMYVVTYGKI